MATRIYTSTTNHTTTSPVASALWEKTTSYQRKQAHTFKDGTALTDTAGATGTGSNPNDVTLRQFVVEEPLVPGQTIAGTFKGQVRVIENNAAKDAAAQCIVRVMNGTTEQAVLYGGTTGALSSEFGTSVANRVFPRAAVAPVTLSSYGPTVVGDRIVIEPGERVYSTDTTSTTTWRFGSAGATDFTSGDETEVGALNAWFEFSQDLLFGVGPTTSTGTGAAASAAASVAPTAGNAPATGAASAPSPKIAPTAGNATGTASASSPGASVFASAGVATASGAANSASVATGVSASAGVATGTGTANTPSLAIAAPLGIATATGAAQGVSASVKPSPGLASATGAANQPLTTQGINASAGVATGTGTANPVRASIAPMAGAATAQGVANVPHPGVLISAEPAMATGQANDATVSAASTTPGSSVESIYATTSVLDVRATYVSTESIRAPRSVELVA